MSTLYITHEKGLEHENGIGHPERPDRLRAIEKVLSHEMFEGLTRQKAPMASVEQLLYAHPENYIDLIKDARPTEGLTYIDGDTSMNPATWDASLLSVGGTIEAVNQVIEGTHKNAFIAMRPPGHHAETSRACGFCIFNQIAIAAHHARINHQLERVAVIDFDVHHGNGTQDIFWSDKDLFYASTHEMPLFPGTGAVNETGVGNICNAPLRAFDEGDKFEEAFNSRILPALKNFSPDLILVSAGFDAHKDDPLANIQLDLGDFAWISKVLVEQAEKLCEGRLVSVLEGGYNLTALAKSTAVHVQVLMDAAS